MSGSSHRMSISSHRMSASSHAITIQLPPTTTLPESKRFSRGPEKPFSRGFFDRNNTISRKIYLRAYVSGCLMVIVLIFAVFPLYWGSLWKTPDAQVDGWVVDFDGGTIGQAVVKGLTGSSNSSISWRIVNASNFPDGESQLGHAVVEQATWVAVAIHNGASARLQASYKKPNTTYNGSEAITVYAAEARNENAYRGFIRPSFQASLGSISTSFAQQSVSQLITARTNITKIVAKSPQTILTPISYNIDNIVPFDIPVATAATFVGLIYQVILSFFVVNIGYSIREVSGLNRFLSYRSLLVLRLVSSFVAYFFISLFYSLVSLAFQVNFDSKFGYGGFVVFWMLSWMGMCSLGLALESLITILTTRFIPFFMMFWIIVNVSIPLEPIEVLPTIFRYGYASPFYNINHGMRCILFGTKNMLGLNFGVLLAWIGISCVTLSIFQWIVRRRDVITERNRMSPMLQQSDILILQPTQKEEKEPKQVAEGA